jgi:hypothetical protein
MKLWEIECTQNWVELRLFLKWQCPIVATSPLLHFSTSQLTDFFSQIFWNNNIHHPSQEQLNLNKKRSPSSFLDILIKSSNATKDFNTEFEHLPWDTLRSHKKLFTKSSILPWLSSFALSYDRNFKSMTAQHIFHLHLIINNFQEIPKWGAEWFGSINSKLSAKNNRDI